MCIYIYIHKLWILAVCPILRQTSWSLMASKYFDPGAPPFMVRKSHHFGAVVIPLASEHHTLDGGFHGHGGTPDDKDFRENPI